MGMKRAVLCVENELQTISGAIERLRNADFEVVAAQDLDIAEELVAHTRFDLLLVDLRLVRGGVEVDRGGVDFLIRLRNGGYGTVNESAPACILTAFVNDSSLAAIVGVAPVFGKGVSVLEEIALYFGRECPWLHEAVVATDSPHVVDDLVLLRLQGEDVVMYTGAWPMADEVVIKGGFGIGNDVMGELGYGTGEVWAWAKLDVTAETVKDLRPHHFRLHISDPQHLEAFEQDGRPDENRAP